MEVLIKINENINFDRIVKISKKLEKIFLSENKIIESIDFIVKKDPNKDYDFVINKEVRIK